MPFTQGERISRLFGFHETEFSMDQQAKIIHDAKFVQLNTADAVHERTIPGQEWVLLSGASGMLGSAVARAFTARGKRILRLVRKSARKPSGEPNDTNSPELLWDPSSGAWDTSRLAGYGRLAAAIHLSGANVSARRWTEAYKREITESRIASTRLLAEGLARLPNPPRVLLSASATGIYGDRGDEILDEDSSAGKGFLADLCVQWEAATKPAADAGIRVVHLRFGVVIGPDGGAMAKLLPLFRLGLGGRLGSGRQWMNWVSETDVVAATIFAMEHESLSGAVNVTAPNPVTNAEFTRQLGHALHRPAILPAPAFALRLAMGEMADEALLASTRAVPKRLPAAGFTFSQPTLAEALAAAVR
jgi:uncharacterized protein